MGGSSNIDVHKFMVDKKAVINSQNTKEQCFKWAILTNMIRHRCYISENYKVLEEKYDFSGLTFPTLLNEIKMFEKIFKCVC